MVWNAGAAEDYRVTTAPSGEPVIANMNLEAENPDAQIERALFRPLPDGISAYELWQVQKRKLGLRQEYLDHWNSTVALTGTGRPVDAIISPMAPYVAPPHGNNKCVLTHKPRFDNANKTYIQISAIYDGVECPRLLGIDHPNWFSRRPVCGYQTASSSILQ